MKTTNYYRDEVTGAVIFNDNDSYKKRKQILENKKKADLITKSNKKVINSLRNEISELKELVSSIINKDGE